MVKMTTLRRLLIQDLSKAHILVVMTLIKLLRVGIRVFAHWRLKVIALVLFILRKRCLLIILLLIFLRCWHIIEWLANCLSVSTAIHNILWWWLTKIPCKGLLLLILKSRIKLFCLEWICNCGLIIRLILVIMIYLRRSLWAIIALSLILLIDFRIKWPLILLHGITISLMNIFIYLW